MQRCQMPFTSNLYPLLTVFPLSLSPPSLTSFQSLSTSILPPGLPPRPLISPFLFPPYSFSKQNPNVLNPHQPGAMNEVKLP